MSEEKVTEGKTPKEKVVFEMRIVDDGEGNFNVEMKGDKRHLKHLRHMHGMGMGPGGPFGMGRHARRAFRRRMMHMHGFRHGCGHGHKHGRGHGYGYIDPWDEPDESVDV